MKGRKIAVIGGGIFGLEIATSLKRAGHQVSLYEKQGCVLEKTTSNNQNRLHLGLHYPRDLETAKQSRIGYNNFLKRYSGSVKQNFPNYYAVSNSDSKTTSNGFINFAAEAQIPIENVRNEYIDSLGFNSNLIDSLWKCEEAVIDITEYRRIALGLAKEVDLKIELSREITNVNYDGSIWDLFAGPERIGSFDLVIRATYGQDRIMANIEPKISRIFEYQQTLVFEVSSSAQSFGLTVIDGDFVTILPSGFSDNFLIYSPIPSVLNRFIGNEVPSNWNFNEQVTIQQSYEVVSKRAQTFAPVLGQISKVRTLKAIRCIEPFVSHTDKRVSSFTETYPNFYDVHSGKVDHAIELAESLVNLLDR